MNWFNGNTARKDEGRSSDLLSTSRRLIGSIVKNYNEMVSFYVQVADHDTVTKDDVENLNELNEQWINFTKIIFQLEKFHKYELPKEILTEYNNCRIPLKFKHIFGNFSEKGNRVLPLMESRLKVLEFVYKQLISKR